MKRLACTLSFLFTALLAACGGGGSSIDIVGLEPAQQAEVVADAICDQAAECGQVTIDCVFDEQTQMTDCTGEFTPVEHDACVAEEEPDILDDLAACDLTAEEEQTLQDCINAIIAQPCVSQEELDAYVEQVEMGSEEPLRETPPECEAADAILDSCTPAT